MTETAALLLMSIAGILCLGAFTRLRWLALASLGPTVGISSYVLIGSVLVLTAGYMAPTATAGATVLILGAIAVSRQRRPDRRTLAAVGMAVIGVVAVAAIALTFSPTRLTPDSLQYIALADMLTEPGGFDVVDPTTMVKRGLTTAIIQTLGSFDGRPYAAVATGVLTIGGFATLAVVLWTALVDQGVSRSRIWVSLTVVTAFVGSTNRAVYDAFYVNSHGPVMAAMLVVVAGSFLAQRYSGWLLPVALSAAVIVAARPEGIVLAALGLLPLISAVERRPLERVLAVAPTSLMAFLWFGVGLWSRAPGERSLDPTDPVSGGLLIGVGLAAVAAISGDGTVRRLAQWIPWTSVLALTVLLLMEVRNDPQVLEASVSATSINLVGQGFWGVSWIVLGALTIAAMLSNGFDSDRIFIIPLAGYGVLFWLLPYIREGAYRVGTGDSGNRVLAHVFLVAIAYVALNAHASGELSDDGDVGASESLNARRARHEAAP